MVDLMPPKSRTKRMQFCGREDYKFSAREIARHRCVDGGINVIRAGDYCVLAPDIWERPQADR
jgi:hypothetical protein